ncbi:hypothetical protein ACLIBG_06070 [Virgibacillus sp. W0181]
MGRNKIILDQTIDQYAIIEEKNRNIEAFIRINKQLSDNIGVVDEVRK